MAPPINDNIEDAIEVSTGTIAGTTTDATTDLDGFENSEWFGADIPSVWYKWTNPGTTVSMTLDTLIGDTPGFDPEGPEVDWWIFEGTPTDFQDLVNNYIDQNYLESPTNGWHTPGSHSSQSFDVTDPGYNVYFWVGNWNYDDVGQGDFSFDLLIEGVSPPVNTVALSFRQGM